MTAYKTLFSSRFLIGVSLLISSLFWGQIVAAQGCPMELGDGGPYVISEGEALSLDAFGESANGPITFRGWDIGGCYLGDGMGLTSNWGDGTPSVQDCLLNAFGSDGANDPMPGAIQYTVDDGNCVEQGSTDLHILNTPPTATWVMTCGSSWDDDVELEFQATDPASSDYPLTADLYIHTQDGNVLLDSLTVAGPDVHGYTLDTTDFPDWDSYEFELQVSDDVDTTTDMMGPCAIENEEEVVEEEEEDENVGYGALTRRAPKKGDFSVDSFFDVFYTTQALPTHKLSPLSAACSGLPLDLENMRRSTVDSFFDIFYTIEASSDATLADSFFDIFIEIEASQDAAAVDSFFDIFTEIHNGNDAVAVDSFFDIFYAIAQEHTASSVDSFFDVFTEIAVSEENFAVDSFFDVFTEVAIDEESTTPDSFFDVFVDVMNEYPRYAVDSFFDVFVDIAGEDDATRVDSFFDVFYDIARDHDAASIDSFFDIFTEIQTTNPSFRVDSFFDVFTELSEASNYHVDSFFDITYRLDVAVDQCPMGNDKVLLDLVGKIMSTKDAATQRTLWHRFADGLPDVSAARLRRLGISKAALVRITHLLNSRKVHTLTSQARSTLREIHTLISQTRGACSDELIAQLQAMKEQLEAQVATLESQITTSEARVATLKSDLAALRTTLAQLKQDLITKKAECDTKKQDLEDIITELDENKTQMEEKEARVRELQRTLTNNDNVTEHVGDNPLGGLDSGAAVTFDGGKTWVVMHGEGGVEAYLESSSELASIRQELRELERDLRTLREEKADLEQKKQDKQQEVDDCTQEVTDLETTIQTTEQAVKDTQAELDQELINHNELKTAAEQLNALIEQFNAAARRCGIQARKVFNGILRQLENMPPDVREEAEEEFDDTATPEEKDARDNPGGTEEGGGGSLTDAGERLSSAMKKVSNCPPPQTRSYGPILDSTDTYPIRGVEAIWISNSQGTRGLTENSQREVLADLTRGIQIVDALSTVLSIADLSGGNPFSLIYDVGFQSRAIDAIIERLTAWQKEGKFKGLPEWIDYSYGQLWEFNVTITSSHTNIYECVDGIWQHADTTYTEVTEQTECTYAPGGTWRYTPRTADLDLRGCTMGGCPNAWADAFRRGFRNIMRTRLRNRLLVECE